MEIKEQVIEQNLLDMAVEAVYRETGIRLVPNRAPVIDGIEYDAALEVEGYGHLCFTAELKRWAQQANLGALANQIQTLPKKGMLVADYVNPNMADKLRELDIPFIDTVGNAYINELPLYIFIKGLKANVKGHYIVPATAVIKGRGRAFQAAGIKMLYAFMRDPELVKAPYRDIVNITGVAQGTVGWVINDLKQGGYLVGRDKQHRRLTNKKHLLDKWVDAYLEKLRPKLFLGTFATENEYWWKELDNKIVDYGARWGGELAAAKLTGHLKPEKITIYLPKEGDNKLLIDNRFRKDPNGNIEVYRAFWGADEDDRIKFNDIVDPIIVYADLLAAGDPRNLETARILYDKKLAGFIEED